MKLRRGHAVTIPEDVHEVDLSDEWLSMLKEVEPAEAAADVAVHEIKRGRANLPPRRMAKLLGEPKPVEEISAAPAMESAPDFHSCRLSDIPAYAEFRLRLKYPPVAELSKRLRASGAAAHEEAAPNESRSSSRKLLSKRRKRSALSSGELAQELPAERWSRNCRSSMEIAAPEAKEEIPELAALSEL